MLLKATGKTCNKLRKFLLERNEITYMTTPIYYCVTVDTEEEWDWNSGYPTGQTHVANIALLPEFHRRITATGAPVVYFTNHAVLANPSSREMIQRISQEPGSEIGLHIHPWNTPPVAPVERVPPRDSFLHNLPWPEAKSKLDTVLSAFREAGLKPQSFRGGRYSSSVAIQNHLRDAGIWIDASVLPYSTWEDEGAPDYRGRDLTPRRLPPRHPGDKPLWELPLSFGYTRKSQGFWNRALKLADTKLGRLARVTGIMDRTGIVSKAWLNFENPLAERMLEFLNVLRMLRPSMVSFTLHSSTLLPGGSPYTRTSADVNRMMERAEAVLNQLRNWPEFAPATYTATATHLESQHR